MELLEEVRLLLNMETPREKLLQIILSGQPELDDLLRRPDLRQFKQRVSCYCRLRPLTLAELTEYIRHRLTLCGAPQQTIFSDPVIQKIHESSHGVPRVINTLCASALQIGFATRSSSITTAIVSEAAKDLNLEVLPEPKFEEPEGLMNLPDMKRTNGHAAAVETNEDTNVRIPLASYASRPKSVSFFAGLMDRWK
jgi:hypothetical protein